MKSGPTAITTGPLKMTWLAYQGIIDCDQMSDKRKAKARMREIIDSLCALNNANKELAQLGRSRTKRLGDVLAFFDVGVSNGSC